MANSNSKIEWTQTTWNPVTGCSKISAGCKHCYAERMAKRLKAMGKPTYKNGFRVTVHKDLFLYPLTIRSPKMIFVNSMSDLFHEDIEKNCILEIFDVMEKAYWHTFQVLTKRSENLIKLNPVINWMHNIWLGVTIENSDCLFRADHLRSTKAKIKFLSLEPLLGPLSNLDLEEIDWVIVGGESSPKARKMELDWVIEIRNLCIEKNVPFFFKQWGGTQKRKNGRLLEGRIWSELPSSPPLNG